MILRYRLQALHDSTLQITGITRFYITDYMHYMILHYITDYRHYMILHYITDYRYYTILRYRLQVLHDSALQALHDSTLQITGITRFYIT